ncbi:MAG: hypothetical protein EP335_15465 [Alphaproteobacteria bacterium]|nr:MAG: hypothetical protein EP335_15465 [Alphaproteobacteria bacterium]
MDDGKQYPDSYDPDKLPHLFAILRAIGWQLLILAVIGGLQTLFFGQVTLGGLIVGRLLWALVRYSWGLRHKGQD